MLPLLRLLILSFMDFCLIHRRKGKVREVEREKERETLTPNLRQSTQKKKDPKIEQTKLSDQTHNVTRIDKAQQRLFQSLPNIQTDLFKTE